MISYIESIQVLLSIATVIGISLLTSYIKMFCEKDISTLRRTIFFVALPALIFYRIALRELIYETWQPLIHSICTQITINVLLLLISLVIPSKNKFTKFLEMVFSCSYSSFFYSYEIINILFGEEYIFVSVVSSIVHYFFMNPLNAAIICLIDKKEESKNLSESNNSNCSDLDDLDDGIEDKKGLPIHPVEPISNSSNNNIDQNNDVASYSDNSNSSIGDIENPVKIDNTTNNNQTNTKETNTQKPLNYNENEDEENDDNQIVSKPEFANSPENVYDYPDQIESATDQKFNDDEEPIDTKEMTKADKFKFILKRVLSPLNIAVILGIIWSIWHWKIPILIEKTTNFLELAVPATGFSCIGFSIWNASILNANWFEVIFFLLAHYIVLPFIAIFWSWMLKFDSTMATICVIANIAPLSFSGFTMAMKSGLEMKSVSDTFVWSNIIFIPVFMLWILGINMTHLFDN